MAGMARRLLCRGLGVAAGPPSTRQLREAEEAAPVFQYAGKAARRKDRVFVWGFSYSGALGIPSFVRPDAGWKKPRRIQPTPYRLETEEKISSAACGYGFTLLASNTRDITKVWGMGLNKDSQLGFQRSRRDQTKGYEYVLEPSPIPLPLEKPQQTRVLQVSCGRAHSLVLTDSEGVFTMGNNSYGQCGRKVVEDEIYSTQCTPTAFVLQVSYKRPDFESRLGTSTLLTTFTRQKNVSMGQFLQGIVREPSLHKLLELQSSEILCVTFSLLGGCLVSSGSHLIHQLKEFDSRVVQVVCGQDHSLFRTKKGTIYACGWGADGQTGLGHYNITSVPTKLHGDIAGVNIIQVSSCGDCCLAVSDEGDVFGWGNSEYLQLASVTETTQVNVPRHLPFKIGKIKEAACGGTGNVVLTEEGNVFVWGYGILGKGPNLIETAVPEMIPPSLFGWSHFSPDIRVAHVRCGLSQFAALTNRGELFVWGKNLRGCLGTGRMEDQYFPWRVTVPGEVVDVACGVDHMVSVVRSFT